ncbi:ATP-binding cassette domain-containing protein [Streptobacillus ratti]|uniref:ATP-binding cassette domain-containing protein n=1 Tax=Streptobacillus ratti TaxID=1720557 RepID=UPI00093430AD|nr:ABC transporter ATP-binding protein [Streptobacillus ratti]
MFKNLKNIENKNLVLLLLLIIIGAISEPLIAYSYVLLGAKIENIKNLDFSFVYIFIIILIALIVSGINYLFVDLIMSNITTNIRKKIFLSILNKKSSEILKTEKTSYYNDILKKIDTWKYRTLKSIIDIFEKALQLIFTLIFISLIDYRVCIVVILFLIPLIINNIFFPKKMEKAYLEYIEKDNEQLKKMKEYFDAILIIKNNNEEKEYSLRMNEVLEEQNFLWKKTSILSSLSAFIANSGVILSQFSGIFISIYFYINGFIPLGSLIALIQLTMFINQPVISLINSVIGINSMKEINEYIENVNNDINEKKSNNFEFDNIEIKDLNFEYIKGKKVFKNNINMTFNKGKKYLIIGESGGGKSTFLKILMKYLENFDGDILINNKSLNDINEEDINNNIFYIPQKIHIFSDTIKNNIDIKNKHSEADILKCMKEVKLENLIKKEHGINEVIGEEINTISGGEAARLYIVKAKLSSKNIIIADEILSNLDKENSLNVEESLLNLEDKMLIHVAHNYNKECMEKYDEIIKIK